jgi:hypothetical protein
LSGLELIHDLSRNTALLVDLDAVGGRPCPDGCRIDIGMRPPADDFAALLDERLERPPEPTGVRLVQVNFRLFGVEGGAGATRRVASGG